MSEFMDNKESIQLNLISFNIMMDFYCNMNQYSKAEEMFEEMEKKKIIPDSFSYSILIKGLKNTISPDIEKGMKIFRLY